MTCRVALLSLMSLFLGCNQAKEQPSVLVSGIVTLDGKPLKEGEVYFVLPGRAPAIFAVKDGNFVGQTPPGTHRVEVYAYRARKEQVGTPGNNMTPPPENYIPEKFNTKSELTAQVDPAGVKPFQFEVQSK